MEVESDMKPARRCFMCGEAIRYADLPKNEDGSYTIRGAVDVDRNIQGFAHPSCYDKYVNLGKQKDAAYAERNQAVALIARMAHHFGLKVGVAQHPYDDESWERDWRTIVFIDLPTGQVSWHFHDSEKRLLIGLPGYEKEWDGHDTGSKYARVNMAYRPGDSDEP
jgi:hypothetical protein